MVVLAGAATAAAALAAGRTFAVATGGAARGSGGFLHSSSSPPVAASVDARPSSGAAPLLGAAALVATAAAGARRATRGRGQQAAKLRGSLVAARSGSTSVDTSGPLPFVTLKRGNDEATVYPYGACVTSYKTDGTEWLAVRPDAKLDGSKPISGGLPFCWPQFGPGAIQQHGFARNLAWKVLEESSKLGTAVFELTDTEETRAMWPHAFRLEYRVELKDGELATTFTVKNTSASDFSFSGALHSYYSTKNVSACKITGPFADATKIDKTQDPAKTCKGTSNDVIVDKMTEEIYKEVLPGSVTLSDPSKGELKIVSGGGWRDVVIWNPYGDEKMGANGFVCVESAEIDPVPLAPNGTWEATMSLVPTKKA